MDAVLLLSALVLDLAFAEPPLPLHPVRWFGKIVEFFDGIDVSSRRANLLLGVLCLLTCAAFAYFLAALPLPRHLREAWLVYLLFSSVSIRSMLQHVRRCIESGMSAESVQMLVSRNAAELDYHQRCSAVIESIAENFVDGVVAPLFYFSIFGVAGAIVYRAVNVCDAMVGYRRGKYEYFGKAAARADDALNFLPARLSLLFFELFRRGSVVYGLKRKVKLNGCSIAAMAHVLGVRLEKPGSYVLEGKVAEEGDVAKAAGIFFKMSLLAAILFALLTLEREIFLTRFLGCF